MEKVIRTGNYIFQKTNKLSLSKMFGRKFLEVIERLEGEGYFHILDYQGVRSVDKKDCDAIISTVPAKHVKRDKEYPSIFFLNGALIKKADTWLFRSIEDV